MSVDWKAVDGILFDMDGVWFVGDTLIPGAERALTRIRDSNIPFRFVTNTTTKGRSQLAGKMCRLGLECNEEEILTTPRATAEHLRKRGKPTCHCVVHVDVMAEFAEFNASDTPDVVVIGDIGSTWNYQIINNAFRMLMAGADLVAMHKGRYWQVDDGLTLDIGAFVAGLEYATDKTATVIGKPSAAFFEAGAVSMGVPCDRVVMVGDDVRSDVGGAMACGMQGVLVETGKYRAELVKQSGVVPTEQIASIAALADLL